MNKADLIDAIASKTGMTKAIAAATTDAFLECVTWPKAVRFRFWGLVISL